MFRRNWFYWVEKLKITPAERITIVSLIALSMLLGGIQSIYDPAPPYENEDYQAIEQLFQKQAERLKRKEARMQARYEGRGSRPIPQSEKEMVENKVDINKADLVALQTLPGIGPALAERIIAYRNRMGLFTRFEEVIRVKGIGRTTLQKIRPKLKLE